MADPKASTQLALATRAIEADTVVRGTALATTITSYTAEKLTEAQRTMLIDDLKEIRDAKDNLEKQMADLCRPFNEGLKGIRDRFKPTIERLEQALRHGKNVELDKRRLERREAAAAALAANAAAAAVAQAETKRVGVEVPEADDAVEAKAAPTNITTGGAGRGIGRKTLKITVTDKAAAIAAYPHLFVFEHKNAVLEVKAGFGRGVREFAGLAWEWDEDIAIGGR